MKRADKKQIKLSHAPLFYESVYKDRFTKDLEVKKDVKLSTQEVRDKCFQLLGFLEQYQTLPGDAKDNRDFEKQLAMADADENELDVFYANFLRGDKNAAEEKTQEKGEMVQGFRAGLTAQIRELLSYPEVRDKFETELAREAGTYQKARPRLQKVAKMQTIERAATSQMVKTYLGSKKQYGKLVQSHKGGIKKLESVKEKAKQAERDERLTAQNEELGWLVTQELLKYKQEMKERGFAMTESRRELFDRIVEHAMSGKRVFLVGSTGTGKTELAFYALDEISGGYEIIPWHEGTSPRDIFGYRELYTDKFGNTVSGPRPGPLAIAAQPGKQKGKAVLHEEYTTGSTRTMMVQKYLMNAKPGQKVKLPGFNGEIFEMPVEMFTGNPKDERTSAREDMDPSILRVLKGVKVQYMPATEMTKIVLAQMMEENGVLRVGQDEIKLIQNLSRAAELMQLFHDRQFESLAELPEEQREVLAQAFGGSADDLSDAKLDKNFLDPGTLFSLFGDFDFSDAKGMSLTEHLSVRLTEFLQDPKNDNAPEEKKIALAILKICGVIESSSKLEQVTIKRISSDKGYTLPSELVFLEGKTLTTTDPFGDGDNTPPGQDSDGTGSAPELEKVERIMGQNFFGPRDWQKIYPDYPLPASIPDLPTNIEAILSENCPFESGKMVSETHLLFLLPETVGGRDFNIIQMREMEGQQKSVQQGNIFWGDHKKGKTSWFEQEDFARKPLSVRWVLMPKKTAPDTKRKDYNQQSQEIVKYGKYATAKAAELTAGLILHYVNTGKRIYESEYGWCEDATSSGNLVAVGFFGSYGFHVCGSAPDGSVDVLGRALVRKF